MQRAALSTHISLPFIQIHRKISFISIFPESILKGAHQSFRPSLAHCRHGIVSAWYYQTSITIQWDLNGLHKHKKHKMSISFITFSGRARGDGGRQLRNKHNFLFHFYFFTFSRLRVEENSSTLAQLGSAFSLLQEFFWLISLSTHSLMHTPLHFLWAANLNFADFFLHLLSREKNPFD